MRASVLAAAGAALLGVAAAGADRAEQPDGELPPGPPPAAAPEPLLPAPDELPPAVLPPLTDLPAPAVPPAPLPPPPDDQSGFVPPPPATFLPPAAVPHAEVRVTAIEFAGHTVVTTADLTERCRWALDRPLVQEDLDQLRFDIASLYFERGYLNSGALLPDQDLAEGILRVRIVEGRLTEAFIRHFQLAPDGRRREVTGTKDQRINTRHLRDRLLAGGRRPLHFPSLQQRLQVLQTNPNLLRLNAELKPGPLPGEALIVVEATETAAPRWRTGVDAHNQRAPSVGGEQLEWWLENPNLTGSCDPLWLRVGLLTGEQGEPEFAPGQTAAIRYLRPLLPDDTTLELAAERDDYAIIEETFAPLDIEGESWSATLGVRRPLLRSIRQPAPELPGLAPPSDSLGTTVHDDLWLSLGLESSHSRTELLGRPFSISPGYVDGELDLTLLRFGQEWTRRTGDSVLALRSTVSLGLDALGATEAPGEPDATFLAWNVSGQYTRRVHERGDTLTLRAGFQWADGPVPPPEQWLLGGRYTVRGYRENSLVRDMGWLLGLEYAHPLDMPGKDSPWRLELVPFIDYGVAWNDGGKARDDLLSAGLGLRATCAGWFRGELFWGADLAPAPAGGDGDLQDHGIHFRCIVGRF